MRPIDADELMKDVAKTVRVTVRKGTENAELRGINKIIDIIKNAPTIDTAPHWISVEERLPEKWKHCLLRFKNNNDSCGGIELGYLASDGKTWSDANHTITHWMPLPEPPKGVE